MTYEIVRFHGLGRDVTFIAGGLSLVEAQAHCSSPESSSWTATDPEMVAYTAEHGPWFEGYKEES